MYYGGTTACGYGGVYRVYPQAQVQQVPAVPRAPVTDAAIRYVPPWETEDAHVAAVMAVAAALYLTRSSWPNDTHFGAISFPPLGQWWPHQYDAPDATLAIRAFLRAFGIRPVPPPPIAYPPPNVTAALFASQEVLYLVAPQALQVGDRPVAFPPLGQWAPQPLPFDRSYYSLRQRLLAIVNPPVLPLGVPAWAAELRHVAALEATVATLLLTRQEVLAPPASPLAVSVSAALVDNWAALSHAETALYLARLEARPAEPAQPTPAWAAELENLAAIEWAGPALFLPRREWKGADQGIVTPAWAAEVSQTAPLFWTQVALYLTRAERKPGEPPQPVAAWQAEVTNLAALMASAPELRLARLERLGAAQGVPIAPWVIELAHVAALEAATPVLYLVRGERTPSEPALVVPAWVAEVDHTAALMATQATLFFARAERLGAALGVPVASWAAELAHLAALEWQMPVVYLIRGERKPAEPAALFPLLGQWTPTREELSRVFFSFRLPQIPPPGPSFVRPRTVPWRPPDESAIWAQRPYIVFVPGIGPVIVVPAGLVGVTVTNLKAPTRDLPPLLGGLIEDADPKVLAPGTIADGENLAPERAPRLGVRGGTRVLLTLHDDAGSPAELGHVAALYPKAATGAVAVGWSPGTTKHYAHAVTSDMAFAGASEALSRTVFPATWNRATVARPVIANLFEKLYVCDATPVYANRNTLVAIDSLVPPGITEPTFSFAAGGAQAMRPYCLEEYNNVLFVAGYGDEGAGGAAADDPARVRHSYLGQPPDAAAGAGFDKDAYNDIGAKGDRVTAMKKGHGLLLVAKQNELYRVTGFGKAYPGWQYAVEGVFNTLGFGVENPLALEHAEDLWFGIGKQGPFMSDGFSVDSLVGPRQRTWRGIDNLGAAFVRYHPERRLVLFGVHVSSGAPDATYPWVLLAWDVNRRVWQPNWRMTGNPRWFVIAPVASTAVVGPAGPPTAPVTSLVTVTSWRAAWTTGDATAETEYWEQDVSGSGAWALTYVAPAGTSLYDAANRTSHNTFKWKVRHRKNGVFSAYTAEQTVQTLIGVPGTPYQGSVSFGGGGGGSQHATVVVQARHGFGVADLVLESSPTGAGTWTVYNTWLAVPNGQTRYVTKPPGTRDWRAKSHDAAWPVVDSAYSPTANL